MSYLPPPPTLPKNSTVDCYIRDSGGDRQDQSTAQQLKEIQTYCASHNLQLRHHFIDEAKSGASTDTRQNFLRMIDLYRHPQHRPRALLLWNYARFARDLNDAIYYKALLRNRNILVHSLTDPIPEGQYGRIIEFFIDISNEEKRRQTSTDAQRGLRELVLKHGCVPGTPPRGFKRQPVSIGIRRDGASHIAHRWVPDPDLVPRVRRAFVLKAEGGTLAQIHNETKLYTGISAYKSLFTNQLFIGILQFGDLTIENYCKPIIDMKTWNAVQKRIESHSQAKYDRHHPRRAHTPYVLSGMVKCGACGSPMSANTVSGGQRGRNEAYRCSRSKRRAGCTASRIGRVKLETAVLDTLTKYILIPEVLEKMYDLETRSIDHIQTKKETQLKTLNAEKRKLTSHIVNLTRAIAEKGHSAALLDRLTQLETQRTQINLEIRELETLHIAKTPPLTPEQITALTDTLQHQLTYSPPQQIRSILLEFIHEIRVKTNDQKQILGTITYFLPSPNGRGVGGEGESPPPPQNTPPGYLGETPEGQRGPHPPPDPSEAGYNLPIDGPPLGAPLYRQTYTHPIMLAQQKRPGS